MYNLITSLVYNYTYIIFAYKSLKHVFVCFINKHMISLSLEIRKFSGEICFGSFMGLAGQAHGFQQMGVCPQPMAILRGKMNGQMN